jgi:hypothetical protein
MCYIKKHKIEHGIGEEKGKKYKKHVLGKETKRLNREYIHIKKDIKKHSKPTYIIY